MTDPILPPEPAKDATADELEADIAATRQQLGETIDALESKLDVSAQAKRKVEQTKTQLTDRVNATKIQAVNKVTAVTTQVTDTVDHARAQVGDKVAKTKAKLTRGRGSTDAPVIGTAPPARAPGGDSSSGASRVTITGEGARPAAPVNGPVKNITTRLAEKISEARTRPKPTAPDGDAGAGLVDATPLDTALNTGGASSPPPHWTSTAAAVTGKVTATTANLTQKASQFGTRTRQNPRSALPAAAALSAVAAVVGLTWRMTRRAKPPLAQT